METETAVIFKKEGKDNDIIAFFPEIPGSSRYDITCYSHVGQHSSASLAYLRDCKPCHDASEYADLAAELTRIGYVLKVYKRRTSKHDAARKAEYANWKIPA